jgi:hypothetical protein
MSFIRSLISERYTYIIVLILSFNEIMPTYSRYAVKGLVYITIVTPSS